VTEAALPIPEEIKLDGGDGVTELARVWWNGDVPAMIIRPALRDPSLMGGVLAELSWNFSRAYAGSHGIDQEQALQEIVRGWQEAHKRAEGLKGTPLMPSVSVTKTQGE